MPTARVPTEMVAVDSVPILYRNVVVPPTSPSPFPAGAAVGILYVASIGGGSVGSSQEFVLCGELPADHPELFVGFLASTMNPGDGGMVITGRGSKVVPILEDHSIGAVLIPGEDVYLSTVPGQVTQTPPSLGAHRLGYAVSDLEMILAPDSVLP